MPIEPRLDLRISMIFIFHFFDLSMNVISFFILNFLEKFNKINPIYAQPQDKVLPKSA